MVRFGPFQLDLETHELFKHGLWPEDSTVDFDRGLGTAMGKLRSALGESATKPLLLETVPRRGFRFVGVIEEGEKELRQLADSRSTGQTYSPEARPRRKAFGVLALLAVAALLSVVAYVLRPGPPVDGAPSVAVRAGLHTGVERLRRSQELR